MPPRESLFLAESRTVPAGHLHFEILQSDTNQNILSVAIRLINADSSLSMVSHHHSHESMLITIAIHDENVACSLMTDEVRQQSLFEAFPPTLSDIVIRNRFGKVLRTRRHETESRFHIAPIFFRRSLRVKRTQHICKGCTDALCMLRSFAASVLTTGTVTSISSERHRESLRSRGRSSSGRPAGRLSSPQSLKDTTHFETITERVHWPEEERESIAPMIRFDCNRAGGVTAATDSVAFRISRFVLELFQTPMRSTVNELLN